MREVGVLREGMSKRAGKTRGYLLPGGTSLCQKPLGMVAHLLLSLTLYGFLAWEKITSEK